MNLIALEVYRLRLEISTGFRWGWNRPLVGRYLWILGVAYFKVGWVSPRQITPPVSALADVIRRNPRLRRIIS